jgi:hypothetical protein
MRLGAVCALLLLAVVLISAGSPASAAGDHLSVDELADLSLEEMLSLQLDQMSITGIHHTHDAGEWMVGYSFMTMGMDGNRSGTRNRSLQDVFDRGYMVAPTEMGMQMHMFHLMYAPADRLTLTLMMPYVKKWMDHLVNPGMPSPMAGTRFETKSEGAGDLRVSGVFRAYRGETHQLLLELGASFPTGSIDEKDDTPMSGGANVRLPYPMQLGSGTYDLLPMFTYIGQIESWTWGWHGMSALRFGENDNDYRLGNLYRTTFWGARLLTDYLSSSVRLEGSWWGNIHGSDPALNPAMVPTADPDKRAGRRLDLLFGLNLFLAEGELAGNRISMEGGLPVYQWLDGPQLETDWMLRISWDWSF